MCTGRTNQGDVNNSVGVCDCSREFGAPDVWKRLGRKEKVEEPWLCVYIVEVQLLSARLEGVLCEGMLWRILFSRGSKDYASLERAARILGNCTGRVNAMGPPPKLKLLKFYFIVRDLLLI